MHQTEYKDNKIPWYVDYVNYIAEGLVRRCVAEEKVNDILQGFHTSPSGEHFRGKRTTYKILQLAFYWLKMNRDAYKFV
ncbi:Transposon Ty3-I Gag-Pol polyprotein [Gossypium australe]|uniref:Transposon Ty3-I Gag-Pol polyprotein n=1 Tax=Gossypium australe TaxID=47621 RepID=A0A5B6VP07_9ROSI|nr:Transposon Ty3-I Gag-Pol polyprotein [Gossypium australe]